MGTTTDSGRSDDFYACGNPNKVKRSRSDQLCSMAYSVTPEPITELHKAAIFVK